MAFHSQPSSAPPRGLLWYLTILAREFPGWVGLNLVFLLTCLPLVTLGPALSALGFVMGRLADDAPVALVRDYLSAFRRRFWPKVGWGLAFLASHCILALAAWSYSHAGPFFFPLAGLTLAGVLLLWAVGLHLFPALSEPEAPSRPLLTAWNAFLSSFGRSLTAVVLALLLLLVQLLLFPTVFPLTLAGGFVLPALALAFPQRKK